LFRDKGFGRYQSGAGRFGAALICAVLFSIDLWQYRVLTRPHIRALFHLAANPAIQRVAGIRLGRVGDVKPNDPDFGESEEMIARRWCDRFGITYLGRADIGHDSANKVVPFGLWDAL